MANIKLLPLISVLGLSACAIKPKPIDNQELQATLQSVNAKLHVMRPEIKSKYLSLHRAIARSIKYNFEARIKTLEQVLATTDLEATSLTMLPSLAANAGYISRSNVNAVLSPVSGQVSTAEDQRRRIADLQLNWSLLDFGISYYMSKQKADEVLIAKEAKRKMIQQLAKETRENFWLAYTLQKYNYLAPRFKGALNEAIYNSRQAQNESLTPPLISAEYRRDVWEVASKVQSQKLSLTDAKPKLLSLIHAPVRQKNIRLITSKKESKLLPKDLSLNLRRLERIALANRPELRQEIYQKRITLNDISQAKLKLLPNPSLGYSGYYDSNSFFVNNNWLISSVNLAWDLLSIPNKLKNIELAGRKATIADLRRLGLAIAITTQVKVAKTAFKAARDLAYYRSKVYQSHKEIYDILKHKEETAFTSKMALSKAYMQMVNARIERDKAIADYQVSAATLLESIGVDIVSRVDEIERRPIGEIIDELDKNRINKVVADLKKEAKRA